MLQRTLPSIFVAALWTIAAVPGLAHGIPHGVGGAKKPAATTSASSIENEVVGSVNGKPVLTFGQLITKAQKANPPAFAATLGQAISQDIAGSFFGASPKQQLVLTRAQFLKSLRAHPPAALVQTLTQELSQEAIRQAGAARHAQPTDAQLDSIVTYLVRQQRAKMAQQIPPNLSDDDFIKMLGPGLTRAKLKSDPNMRVSATMFNLARLDLEKKLKHPIGDADFVEARHILVKADPIGPTATPEQKKADADALIKITQFYNDISTGQKKFEQVAKDSSDDPGSKESGGSLGVFMPDGSMVKEFQEVAFASKVGQVSKPFRTQFGYHILEVTKTGKEMKPDERQNLLMEKERAQSNVTYQQIASSSKIVNKLQPEPTIPIPGQ